MKNDRKKSLKVQLSKVLKLGIIYNEHKETTLYHSTQLAS